MRRLGYISTSILLGLAASLAVTPLALGQSANSLRPAQSFGDDPGLPEPPPDPGALNDDTFAQTLPLDDTLADPAETALNRGQNQEHRERRRTRTTRDANAVPDLSEAEIPPIPNGIPDRPFDLTTQDPASPAPEERADPAQRQTRTTTQADPYAPLGIRSGSFLVFPEFQISGVYTDNVGQDEIDERSAAGVVLRPGITVQSNWATHSARLALNSEHTYFAGEEDENRNQLNAALDLNLDLQRSAGLEIAARYQLSQDNTNDETGLATTGTSINHEVGGDVTLSRRNAKILPSIRAGVDAFLYGEEDLSAGGIQDNSDRDYVEPDVEVRLTYAHTRAVQPYVAATYSRRMHKEKRDRNGLERDSDGYELKGGVDLDLSTLLTGNIEVGYGVRDYEDANLKTTGGLVGTSRLTWNPTPLTSLALSASGSIDETTTAGASGIRSFSAGATLTHRFRRYLTGTAGFTASFGDYVGIRRLDETYQFDLGFALQVTRNVDFTGQFNHVTTKSNGAAQDYSENQFSAGMRFRL